METEMIIGNTLEIAIQLEYTISLNSPSGLFNFVIDDNFIPGRGTVIDLYVVISSLKDSLSHDLLLGMKELGSKPLDTLDFSNGAPQNVIWLDSGELSDYGCVFWLAFDGDEERFFYSVDYEKTIQEKRYPRGTVEKLISNLPSAEQLNIKNISDMVTITDYQP